MEMTAMMRGVQIRAEKQFLLAHSEVVFEKPKVCKNVQWNHLVTFFRIKKIGKNLGFGLFRWCPKQLRYKESFAHLYRRKKVH